MVLGHFWTFNFEVNNYFEQQDYVKYFGNNELHVENEDQQIRYKELLDNDEINTAETMKRSPSIRLGEIVDPYHPQLIPFYGHHYPHFLVSKSQASYQNRSKKMKEPNQYFVKTNENQYLLVYPNYKNNTHKFEVL